ncbi:DUF2516 family protein [Dermabacter hominis]|uniref:DUF2516 family protein n=1 Tax=Dermabacter hominis TaxID=36740 RepID=UPI00223A9D02|nr:DUF2516 family protein [Dermabacter hominis]MCT2025472.1 DUF2516 family protein [Dermabacter hominis]
MITYTIAYYLSLALAVVFVAIEAWALVNALRFPARAYDAAFKRTKTFWALMTAGALVIGVVTGLGRGVGPFTIMLQIIGFVMAGVFLADVLPALRQVMGNAQGRDSR